MTWWVKRQITIVPTIFSLGLLLCSGCGSSGATETTNVAATYDTRAVEPTVRVQPVESHVIRSQHEFTGNLLPRRRIQVSAEVAGVVT